MKRETITRAAAAKALGKTVRSLQTWERDMGLASARAQGARPPAYRTDALLKWLYNQSREGSPLNQAKARKEGALAQLREFEVAERQGQLIHVDDIKPLVTEWLSRLRAHLLALPGRLVADLPGDPAENIEMCEPIIHEFMGELAGLEFEESDDDDE